jgi:CheY-like chemotaxis protein
MIQNSDSLQGLRIFVVEDESLISMMIEDILGDLGCDTVKTASDLTDALAKASELDFDAAVLDINLRGANTFQVAEFLSQKRVPFIFSTGYGAQGLPEHFKSVPVLPKPFSQSQLDAALRKAINAHLS